MKRFFEDKLLNWKKSGMKKPLMVVGARQTGKTYTILEFVKNNFDNYLYFNLEKDNDIKEIFRKKDRYRNVVILYKINFEIKIKN